MTNDSATQTITMPTAIALSDVSFGYTPSSDVLHHVSADVPTGATCAVLGPNGAGKSTLLELIAGLRTPRSGSLRVHDTSVTGAPSSRPENVMLVTSRTVPPAGFTIASLLRYVAKWHPRWDNAVADDLLSRFALASGRRLDTLSFGGQMKVQLITALASQPRVLLLDEPFVGLDVATKEALIDGLLSVDGTASRTTLIASHDLVELELLVDHLLVLTEGRVHLAGNLDALRAQAGTAATLREFSRPSVTRQHTTLELAV